MRNFLSVFFVALSFYAFIGFMTLQAYLKGNTQDAIQSTQIGAVFALISYVVIAGYYVTQWGLSWYRSSQSTI